MRLQQRRLTGPALHDAVASIEIIEAYPGDKYLPSYLVRGETGDIMFHAHVAADVDGNNIRVVTMYVPDPQEWDNNGRIRRSVK